MIITIFIGIVLCFIMTVGCTIDFVIPVCSILLAICFFTALNQYENLEKRIEKLEAKENDKDNEQEKK